MNKCSEKLQKICWKRQNKSCSLPYLPLSHRYLLWSPPTGTGYDKTDRKILQAIILETAWRHKRVSDSAALKTGLYTCPKFSCDSIQVGQTQVLKIVIDKGFLIDCSTQRLFALSSKWSYWKIISTAAVHKVTAISNSKLAIFSLISLCFFCYYLTTWGSSEDNPISAGVTEKGLRNRRIMLLKQICA